ncbi:hypothetical protein GGTG_09758 [Gaeumannomyces tritici R3-111a-1]|uniref:Uncharacterized protein n=1 Tax=Gaeumannomyces tritici (strain R3-111a-1) TaxID=644352 RepID=J3P8C4_GAET3|nr:hypothetical protein GGTG_09758 [Gaeumannomyces tritici R3-111a-1]EJT72907.1 hypothetical protein GGTG_09758 [Gaeumannomyces tritici R3-111a-1]
MASKDTSSSIYAASSSELVGKAKAAAGGKPSLFSRVKAAFKSPAAERGQAVMDARPPRRDSDEWSYMTDPEDETRQIKKRKKKMVEYKPLAITQGSLASQGAVL